MTQEAQGGDGEVRREEGSHWRAWDPGPWAPGAQSCWGCLEVSAEPTAGLSSTEGEGHTEHLPPSYPSLGRIYTPTPITHRLRDCSLGNVNSSISGTFCARVGSGHRESVCRQVESAWLAITVVRSEGPWAGTSVTVPCRYSNYYPPLQRRK